MAKQTTPGLRADRRSAPGAAAVGPRPVGLPFRDRLWWWPLVAAIPALAIIAAIGAVVVANRSSSSHTSRSSMAVLHTPDYHALAFSPASPSVIFFGYHNGLMRSDDGGRSFRSLVSRNNFDAMNLAVNPTNPQQLYLAGHDTFAVSRDGGTSWQQLQTTLPGTDMHGFTLDPDDPTHLTAFIVGAGMFASPDGGHAWQRLPGQVPSDVMSLVSAGGTPETLYATSMQRGVLRSNDGGKSFVPTSAGVGGMVTSLAIDYDQRTTLYAGTDAGLFRSTDAGASWSKLSFPGNNAIVVGVSWTQPSVVMAISVTGDEGVVTRSDDGGTTWTASR